MVIGVKEDNRGAPASNAGDRFHELWALRKALSLLDPESQFRAMTVEGVPLKDSSPEVGSWDAVDVCLMAEGESLGEASSVVIAQLKYSTTNPTATWTVTRLAKNDAKKGNNSPIRKLAESFLALEKAKKNENPNLKYKLQLVSNQPINDEVLLICKKIPFSDRVEDLEEKSAKLIHATGLSIKQFEKFIGALDFSECGSEGIFEQEVNAIRALQNLIEGNSRQFQLELHRYLADEMLPGRTRTPITEFTLLARLGIMNEEALFPCSSSIKRPNATVHRESVEDILTKIKAGLQYLLIHGGAGCGKTTSVGMLTQQLPKGSFSVVFDCYGGGSYLDASKPRHRPKDAFTQMSNELAARLRVPRLLRINDIDNAVKAFRERLELGAEILKQSNPDAILLIAVDAADNAVSAAAENHEYCFVHELVSMQNLPKNVRIVVSARSSRRTELKLPPSFVHEEIKPFSLSETGDFLKLHGANQGDDWIADFHRLTRGIPRVQAYSFGLNSDLRDAMNFLLPYGKNLNEIFEQTVKTAWERGGGNGNGNAIATLCAALIALPRPVPIEALAHATGLNPSGVMDLCADLVPTLRIDANRVSFSDEDFEEYVANRGASELVQVRRIIAQEMLRTANCDSYSASHVVTLLIDAGMEREALLEATKALSEQLFPDPMIRRVCHLERMRSALKVCSRTGNGSESLSILLAGAEALRTTDAIADMLARNPSLATKFARDAVDKLILSNQRFFAAHGPVLCRYMAHDAKGKLFSRVAYSKRMFLSWNRVALDDKSHRDYFRDFTLEDGGAFCYAILMVEGTEPLRHALVRFGKSRHGVFLALVGQLLNQREVSLLENLLSLPRLKAIERIHILVSLIRLGVDIGTSIFEVLLARLITKGMFDIVSIKDDSKLTGFREDVLEIAEHLIFIQRAGEIVEQLLSKWVILASFCKDLQAGLRRPTSHFLMKLECLIAQLEKKEIEPHVFLGLESPPSKIWTKDLGVLREVHSQQLDLYNYYERMLPFYRSRAKYIHTGDIEDFLGGGRSTWASQIGSSIYRHRDFDDRRAYIELLMAASMAAVINDKNTCNNFSLILEIIESADFSFNAEDICRLLRPFTWRSNVHGKLTEYVNRWMSSIALRKISSSEKANSYLALATLVENVSNETSEYIFSKAFVVLEEIDYHELSLLSIFDKLTKIVGAAMSEDESRSAAVSLASFGTDVAMRLREYDHFPWAELSRAIGRLNAPVALATASRWEDEDLGINTETLQVILHEGIRNKQIPVTYAAANRYLAERTSTELISEIALVSGNSESNTRCVIQEILAECEALLNDTAPRPEIDTALMQMNTGPTLGRWTRYLKARIEFLRNLSAENDSTVPINFNLSEYEHRKVELLDSLEWDSVSFQSAGEIRLFVEKARVVCQQELYYLDEKELYRRIRARVFAHHQVVFLDFLSEEILGIELSYTIADVLTDSIEDWVSNSVIVQTWCIRYLPELLSSRLIMFLSRMYVKMPIERLINSKCIPINKFYESILSGIPRCLEKFDARMIYEIVQIVAELLPATEVSQALKSYLDRLLSKTAREDRFDLSDLPIDIAEAQARLLFANLGDVSLSVRWRAAHAVRAMFELECFEVIDKIIKRYSMRDEQSFRAKDAPFYWAAARLWFVIAISRACVDKPTFASRYSDFLLSVLSDSDFPHLLVQRFAQKSLQWLQLSGAVTFNSAQKTLIQNACTSQFQPQKREREKDRDSDDLENRSKTRRFQFDGLDTLRYWYPGCAQVFANVSLNSFVDEAEKWIVDKWGITQNPWRWDDEPRRNKFERYGGLVTSHSHGSLPRAERFSTHVEWHAMWCSIGSLMKTHPLKTEEYEVNSFFETLDNSTVVTPPILWLSDLRSPKPLESQFWTVRSKSLPWVREPNASELLSVLGLGQASEWLLVSGNYNCYWQKFQESVSVTSCLVSKKTSSALLKALQGSSEIYGHSLPFENSGDIISPPFVLEPWLLQTTGQSGLDEKDSFGENLSSRVCRPDAAIIAICGLAPSAQYNSSWHEKQTSELAFFSEQWTEHVPENRYHCDWQWLRSTGERLHCKRNILERVFEHTQRDLLVKIHINRKQNEDTYGKDDEAQNRHFNSYFIIRQEGSIETVEGPIGTWKAPR